MILTPTFEDVVNNFIKNLDTNLPEASTTSISVIRESLVNPSSTQIAFLFDLTKQISVIQDIFNATGSSLDIIANSYGLTRKTGLPATGSVYLDLGQLEFRDTITVSSGSQIRSRSGGTQSSTFGVTGDFIFAATDRALFEANAALIRAELDSVGLTDTRLVSSVPIRATSVGTQTNVGAYSLNNANISNINNIINTNPTTGGTPAESDDSLRQRLVALFTGNSTGTEAGLLSAASSVSSVTGAFMVKAGDPLMTRDGSVYDEDGNLITAGTGRAVDIYISGSSITSETDRPVFDISDQDNFLSINNAILIGQPSEDNFGTLPVTSVGSIAGDESGASFTQGVQVTDEDGNITIEGSFALIKDVEADQYSVVENLVTRERKLATFISPTSSKYTTIGTLTPSDFANSPFSQDRVLFLRPTVNVADESLTRGQFNGADQLRFTNVTATEEIFEEKTITDTIKIEDLTEVSGGVAINTKHAPVLNINSIFHTRLGINISFELLDATTGLVRLISRTPPRQGDILKIEYVWKQEYQEDLNFSLTGDLIDWVGSADERGRVDSTLLPEEDLQAESTLALQPNIASYLEFEMTGLADREVIETKITGTSTEVSNEQLALKTDDAFRFATTGTSNIGRIFKVTNASQGFDYNLAGYDLNSNKLDPKSGVDTSLLPQQFQLSSRANTDALVPGDRILLGRPSQALAWSSQSDFENNVRDNLAPIYDPTTLDFTPGGITLKNPLDDDAGTATSLSGFITQDTTLSGVVEILADLTVTEGVVLDIEPNTVIKVRPSDQLQNQLTFAQRTTFTLTLDQQDTVGNPPTASEFEEFVYVYFKPEDFPSNFFTIINDEGQVLSIRFDEDILTKQIVDGEIEFHIAGRKIDSGFNDDLESTIDLLDITSSIKASLLGARSGQDGLPKFTAAYISSKDQYYVLLDRDPVLSGIIQDDFTLTVESDSSITFDRFIHNATLNALIVDGNLLEIDGYGDTFSDTDYIVTHLTEERTRVAIIVEGTLRILGATPQTSVLFTTAGDSAKVGDWEGIVFTSKSHSTNPRTVFQSDLSNARIRYANVGVSAQASDVNIQNCVIRDNLETGINITSRNESVSQFTDDFNLTVVGDPFANFSSTTRLGFTPTDDVRIARYPIPENMVTAGSFLPQMGLRLTPTSYIVEFNEGTDFTVFVQSQRATSVDTTLPPDGYSDHSLTSGSDFMIEFDINDGFSLVFLYTAGTAKLRNVFDLITDLESTSRTGEINVDFFKSVSNGIIFDNLILNSDTGMVLNSLATLSVNKNTIDNTRLGIVAIQTIATIKNNLITGYSTAPLVVGDQALVRAQRNDIYSNTVVEQEQTGIFDTDILLRPVTTSASTLIVRSPNKYRVSSVIKIDNEEMLVQGINPDSIIVARAQNGTAFAAHSAGALVTLFQLNQIFTVTGIDGDACELIETDSTGTPNALAVPIQMRLLSPGTFRAAFPINRRADFFYKYRFSKTGNPFEEESETRVLPREQPGVGVNDIATILHEIPLNTVSFTPDNENYSADPLYTLSSSADYSFSAINSLASKFNPIYGSLIDPNSLHRYVGSQDVLLTRSLTAGATRIPVPHEPLVVLSLSNEVTVVGVDTLNQGVELTVGEFSFSVTQAEADQGAIGVFILASSEHPSGVVLSGQYQLSYERPVDLGTSLPPYYLESEISYIVDAGSNVTFDNVVFNKDETGGQAEFTFQVADSIANLQTASRGTSQTTSPIILDQVTTTNIGRAIQINVNLKGNDSSYTADQVIQFPILEDYALTFLPAKDTTEYSVLSLIKNDIQNETNILIDQPITTDTFSIVGSDDTLEIFLRKKSDNFDPADEFLIGTAQGVSVGDTFVTAKGDLTTSKPDALSSDTIRVDYLSFQDAEETLYFVQDGSQVSEHQFGAVSRIENTITKDQETSLPTTEIITVRGLTQPDTSVEYKASYAFQAPLDGETLTVLYNYNETVRDASIEVDTKKSIFTDVLVKQVKDVPVEVGIALEVTPGAPPLSVESQVSAAIANLFSTEFLDINSERRLDTSDIIRATGDISGIEDIQVTTLSRRGISGEVVSPIVFERKENVVLEENSPRINTTQNGRTIVLGSS